MGSRERDSDAILKLAEVASGLAKVGASGLRLPLEPKGMDLEGGQGFLPTHSLEDVKARLAAAFEHGVSRWREIFGISDVEATAWIHFDKLHNEAYNSNEQAIGTRALADASALLTDVRPSITGWQVSCDARIFARQSGDVTTFGAGSLDLAHGPREVVTMDDIMTAAAMLTMAILAKQEGLGG